MGIQIPYYGEHNEYSIRLSVQVTFLLPFSGNTKQYQDKCILMHLSEEKSKLAFGGRMLKLLTITLCSLPEELMHMVAWIRLNLPLESVGADGRPSTPGQPCVTLPAWCSAKLIGLRSFPGGLAPFQHPFKFWYPTLMNAPLEYLVAVHTSMYRPLAPCAELVCTQPCTSHVPRPIRDLKAGRLSLRKHLCEVFPLCTAKLTYRQISAFFKTFLSLASTQSKSKYLQSTKTLQQLLNRPTWQPLPPLTGGSQCLACCLT